MDKIRITRITKIKSGGGQLEKYPIYVNAFEAGLLTALIFNSDKKDFLKNVFNQLLDLSKKFREAAGVTVTDLGNGYVMLADRYGNAVIRQKYEWED